MIVRSFFSSSVLSASSAETLAFPVFVDPPVVDHPDRNRIQEMQLLPAGPAGDDEAGIFQNLQMLHDAEARHRQPGFQFFQLRPSR